MPNKHSIGDNEYRCAREFIQDYVEKKFSDVEKCVVQTVGIPTGLLSSLGLSTEKFSITREAEFMFFPSHSWSSKQNVFHPSVYLIPGAFSNCDENSSFQDIVSNARYFICDKSTSTIMSYSEAADYLSLSGNEASTIFTNHCLDYSLSLCVKITTGVNFSEETFRLNKKVNQLFVSGDGQKNIEALLTTVPEGFDSIFGEDGIGNSKQVAGKLPDSTLLEINNYLGSLESRLITPEEIPKKCLGTRIFDRVFNLFVHPDEHYTTRTSSGLKRVTVQIDGIAKSVYQIDLTERGANSVKNDHFASYYYKVEEL